MVSHLLLALACALPVFAVAVPPTANRIRWSPCPQNGTVPLTCGKLTVPLDYTDLGSNKTIDLDLVKVSAAKQPKKGSILFNPGGPGGGGRDFVVDTFADGLRIATGGSHDLIGFDTRYVV